MRMIEACLNLFMPRTLSIYTFSISLGRALQFISINLLDNFAMGITER